MATTQPGRVDNRGGSGTTDTVTADTTRANAAPVGPRQVFSVSDWEARMRQVRIGKRDINRLVMNYLVVEGYADAASAFASESGTEPGVDLSATQQRLEARALVQKGAISEAIERVNDMNPEILDANPTLHFHLQQQRLIELIRRGQTEEAIAFAQSELAPRGQEDERYLEELERTMALLIYDANEHADSDAFRDLFDERQRARLASELNAAILASQNQEISHKLPRLVRLLRHAERDLQSRGVTFPELDWESGTLREPSATVTSTATEQGPSTNLSS
ncbi:hypothetical protein CCYA_CCYA17G4294 [Cyanidiococcus yangmingshanensis]|nr:hypothetical protein CCYA_CCYA17G4294 [Cyanidiococcus yangmingshanensis]